MISDDELRNVFNQVAGKVKPNPQNPMLRYGKGTEIEDCVCEESCDCDPCPCDECEGCNACLCCCYCTEDDEEEDEEDMDNEEE